MSGHIGGICIMPASDTDNAKRAAGWVLPLHGHAYESNIYIHMSIYGLVFRVPTPPVVWVPRLHPLPFYLQAIGSISEVHPRIC